MPPSYPPHSAFFSAMYISTIVPIHFPHAVERSLYSTKGAIRALALMLQESSGNAMQPGETKVAESRLFSENYLERISGKVQGQ
jgi:hypothetical protein